MITITNTLRKKETLLEQFSALILRFDAERLQLMLGLFVRIKKTKQTFLFILVPSNVPHR